MSGLKPRARQMLRTYRRERTQSEAERAALWERIDASIESGGEALGVSSEVPSKPRRAAAIVAISFGVVGVATVGILASLSPGPGAAPPPPVAKGTTEESRSAAPPRTPAAPGVAPIEHALEATPVPVPVQRPRGNPATSRRRGERSRPQPRDERSPPNVVTADVLREEMGLIQRARSALLKGETKKALSALDEHARRFPSGQMREDQAALRIEALCGLGNVAEAHRLAKRFAKEFPRSAHVARVRTLCAERQSVP